MHIDKVGMKDFSSVLSLFRAVKGDLAKQNNDQWKWIYPNRFTYKKDIAAGRMYGIKEGSGLTAVYSIDDEPNEKYTGFIWKDLTGKACSIHRLAVHPKQQGRGLGKTLLNHAELLAHSEGYTSIRIDVYCTNTSAIGLYEKYGYERIGEVNYPMRKHAYITMEKLLNKPIGV